MFAVVRKATRENTTVDFNGLPKLAILKKSKKLKEISLHVALQYCKIHHVYTLLKFSYSHIFHVYITYRKNKHKAIHFDIISTHDI